MTAFTHILCPVDFSDFSRHALDHAVALARQHSARLTALYVVPPVQTTYPAIGLGAYVPYTYTIDDLKEFQRALERFVADVGYPVAAVSVEALVYFGGTLVIMTVAIEFTAWLRRRNRTADRLYTLVFA